MSSADSEPYRQLIERRDFFESEHLECVSMERLPFEGAFDECPCKPLTNSHWLGVVEVPSSTWTFFQDGENAFQLVGVLISILRQGEIASIEETAQDNKGAHLELTSESLKVICQVVSIQLNATERSRWEEKLCSDFVAPPLRRVTRRGTHLRIV